MNDLEIVKLVGARHWNVMLHGDLAGNLQFCDDSEWAFIPNDNLLYALTSENLGLIFTKIIALNELGELGA